MFYRQSKEPLTQEQEAVERRHKETTYRATILGTIASAVTIVVVIGPAVAWFARPALVAVLAEAMAPAVSAQVKRELSPLAEGFKVILLQNINRLRREIAELERRDRQGGLTAGDTRLLADKRIELEGQQNALAAIIAAENEAAI